MASTTDAVARERLLDEIVVGFLEARDEGRPHSQEELVERHPELRSELIEFFDAEGCLDRAARELSRREPEEAAQDQPERVGDYRILEEIGRGGMGVVYRARQIDLERDVALKMILGGRLASEHDRRRFRREMRLLASVDHPHIVPIYDVGEHRGSPYYAMKLVQGGPLSARIEHFVARPSAAALLVEKLARAVHVAHRRGILHRDLKPANVLIDADGEPRITDFGLAKELGADNSLTRSDATVGTPRYMAPEQASGRMGEVGIRADVYSLGAILYELLTSRPPFRSDSSFELLRQVVEDEPSSPRRHRPRLSRDLETICLRCLEKRPERRYRSALELAEELQRFREGLPIHARSVSSMERLWRWCRRNPAPVTILLLSILVAVGSAAAALKIAAGRSEALGNLGRARRAEAEVQDTLRASLLAQARALRSSGRQGQRTQSLAAVERASRIAPGLAVRNEAIAALAYLDVVDEPAWAGNVAGTSELALDRTFEHLARGADDGSVSVRALDGDRELVRLEGPGQQVCRLDFSPDGRWLAAKFGPWHVTGEAIVWDWAERRVVLRRSDVASRALAFDPDSRSIVLGDSSGRLRRFELEGGRQIEVFESGLTPTRLCFGPEGRRLAVQSDHRVQILLPETGRVERTLIHPDWVWDMAWSPDGGELVVGCKDLMVHVWNVGDGSRRLLEGHDATVTAVGFGLGGRVVISSSWDGTTRVWDRRTGTQRIELGTGLPRIQVDPSGERLGLFRGGERLWITRVVPSAVHTHLAASPEGVIDDLDFDSSGRLLVASGEHGASLWDVATTRRVGVLPARRTFSAFFHDATDSLVTCGLSGLLRWPIVGEGRLRFGPPETLVDSSQETLQRAVPSADGRSLAVNIFNGRDYGTAAWVIDARTGEPRSEVLAHPGVHDVGLSSDGRWLASAPWLGHDLIVWDLASDPPTRTPLWTGPAQASVRFSPRGTWLATASSRGHELWRTGTWERLQRWPSEGQTAMAFSSDESMLAVLAEDATVVRLLDPRSGMELASLEAPDTELVRRLAFSPDGRWLAAGGRAVNLWDLWALRDELARLGLDWGAAGERPPAAADGRAPSALELEVDLGPLADPERWEGEPTAVALRAALASLDRRLALDADDVDALRRRARVLESLARPLDAVADYDRLLALGERSAALLVARGRNLAGALLWERAALDYGGALELEPERIDARALRARARTRLGRGAAALADLDALLERRPLHRDAVLHAAWLLAHGSGGAEARDLERAERLARRALEAWPTDADAWNVLGAVLVRAGRCDEASAALERAVGHRTRPAPQDQLLLALCHHGRGDLQSFRRCYVGALAERGLSGTSEPALPWADPGALLDEVRSLAAGPARGAGPGGKNRREPSARSQERR